MGEPLHIALGESAEACLHAACRAHGMPGTALSIPDDLSHGPLDDGRARHRFRAAPGPFDGFRHRPHLPDPEAGDELRGRFERPIGHRPSLRRDRDTLALGARLQALSREQDPGFDKLFIVLAHCRQQLRGRHDTRLAALGRLYEDHHSHVAFHFGFLGVLSTLNCYFTIDGRIGADGDTPRLRDSLPEICFARETHRGRRSPL
jgi:hypothetical protein